MPHRALSAYLIEDEGRDGLTHLFAVTRHSRRWTRSTPVRPVPEQ
jgi:hypothetical protein